MTTEASSKSSSTTFENGAFCDVIDYMADNYSSFRRRMMTTAKSITELKNWTYPTKDDYGTLFVEFCAYVADVLAYYQDRYANEAFLRTAVLQESIIRLCELIDYRFDAGAAAIAYQYFKAESEGTVEEGFQLSTKPPAGEQKQTFETDEELKLYPEHNEMELFSSASAGDTWAVLNDRYDNLAAGFYILFENRETGDKEVVKLTSAEVWDGIPPFEVDSEEDCCPPMRDTICDAEKHTRIDWEGGLLNDYPYEDAVLKGNIVPASHGESVTETLGSGDASEKSQSFTLRYSPVTHVFSATDERGTKSTLEVYVSDVRWTEVRSFLNSGPTDEHYVTIIDEDGIMKVTFGDGERGAVLPSGTDNVMARYRKGLGVSGNISVDTLTQMVGSNQAVESTTNPLPASGGAEPEKIGETKIKAPQSVIPLDRAVSAYDFSVLATNFSGIEKARSYWKWVYGRAYIHLVVAPSGGGTATDQLLLRLREFFDARRVPHHELIIESARYVPVYITANVHVDDRHFADKVKSEVETVLSDTQNSDGSYNLFAFKIQQFGEAIHLSDIYAAIESVEGVAYAVVTQFGDEDEMEVAESIQTADNELITLGSVIINVSGGASS